MGENLDIEGRRSVRTPMQWTDGPTGGFSRAAVDDLRRPPPGGDSSPDHVNVRDQRRDPDSLLRWFEHVIGRRREVPEIGRGAWQVVDVDAPSVVVLQYALAGRTVVTLHHLGSDAVEVVVDLGDQPDGLARDLLGADDLAVVDGRLDVSLAPFAHRWFRLESDD